MIEVLILYFIHKQVSTMYGIYQFICNYCSTLLIPSYGTIKPALVRLEKSNYLKSQKSISKGGRVSAYYSITKDGEQYLRELLLDNVKENPVQFFTNSRIKLLCSDILNSEDQFKLYMLLKNKAENIQIDANNFLKNNELNTIQQSVYNNIISEYQNFISLLEGLIYECKY